MRKLDKYMLWICTGILTAFFFATVIRNETWRSEQLLWADAVSKSPGSPRAHINLGNQHQKNGNLELAMREYQTAADLAAARLNAKHTDFTARDMLAVAQVGIAGVFLTTGDRKDAEAADQTLNATLALMPSFGPAVVMLSTKMIRERRYAEAITLIEGSIRHGFGTGFTQYGRLYFNEGMALCELGFTDLANGNFRLAGQFDPDFAQDQKKTPRFSCGEKSTYE